jgi:hypothetical protein
VIWRCPFESVCGIRRIYIYIYIEFADLKERKGIKDWKIASHVGVPELPYVQFTRARAGEEEALPAGSMYGGLTPQ